MTRRITFTIIAVAVIAFALGAASMVASAMYWLTHTATPWFLL